MFHFWCEPYGILLNKKTLDQNKGYKTTTTGKSKKKKQKKNEEEAQADEQFHR